MNRRGFLRRTVGAAATAIIAPTAAVALMDRPRQAPDPEPMKLSDIDGILKEQYAAMQKQLQYQAASRAAEQRRRMESMLYGMTVG